MHSFVQEQQQLRQIIEEMEAALDQPNLAPGALQGWQTTFQEVSQQMNDSPPSDSPADGAGLQHLRDRARNLLSELTQAR